MSKFPPSEEYMSERSDYCWMGEHESCDGCNLGNVMGCLCPCHYEEEEKEKDIRDQVEKPKKKGKKRP